MTALAAKSDEIFAANRAVGSLAFSVKTIGGNTRRDRVHEAGSLRVRCPGAPAAELEAVIINTAGGVAGGDRFDLDIVAGTGTRLVVTTAAAEKVYRTLGPDSTIGVKLDVAAGRDALVAAAGDDPVRPRAAVALHRRDAGAGRPAVSR